MTKLMKVKLSKLKQQMASFLPKPRTAPDTNKCHSSKHCGNPNLCSPLIRVIACIVWLSSPLNCDVSNWSHICPFPPQPTRVMQYYLMPTDHALQTTALDGFTYWIVPVVSMEILSNIGKRWKEKRKTQGERWEGVVHYDQIIHRTRNVVFHYG